MKRKRREGKTLKEMKWRVGEGKEKRRDKKNYNSGLGWIGSKQLQVLSKLVEPTTRQQNGAVISLCLRWRTLCSLPRKQFCRLSLFFHSPSLCLVHPLLIILLFFLRYFYHHHTNIFSLSPDIHIQCLSFFFQYIKVSLWIGISNNRRKLKFSSLSIECCLNCYLINFISKLLGPT